MTKVFISYSHDSPEHVERVLRFADALRRDGLDTEIDQYHPLPPQGWPAWWEEQLRPEVSSHVLMICTQTYYDRVQKQAPDDEGLGLFWEGRIIQNYIYGTKRNERFIPVLFDGTTTEHIPLPIRHRGHYRISRFDLTDPGYEALCRDLTGQPYVTKPDLGNRVPLPERQSQTTSPPVIDPSRLPSSERLIGRDSGLAVENSDAGDVFISYVRTDRPKAERLANALQRDGWTIWWDTTLLAGDLFEEVITAQLQAAKCVVVLWSAASVQSDWVRDEAAEAKRRRVFVPCLIEPVLPPMGYRQYHTVDLSSWDGDTRHPNFQALKRAIARHIPAVTLAPLVVKASPPVVEASPPAVEASPPAVETNDAVNARPPLWGEQLWQMPLRAMESDKRRPILRRALLASMLVVVITLIGLRDLARVDYSDLKKPMNHYHWMTPAVEDGKIATLPFLRPGIVGADDRVRVPQTTSFPWAGICALHVRASDGTRWVGTGVVIGPRAILTADYVVFLTASESGGRRRAAVEVEVIPALNGKIEPFGRFVSSKYHWVSANGHDDDPDSEGLAIIELDEPPKNPLCPLPLGQFNGGDNVALAGYPGDRDGGTGLYRSSGRILGTESTAIYYDADTAGGMSGAPVWRLDDTGATVVGIHMGSTGKGKHALRFTKALLGRLKEWVAP